MPLWKLWWLWGIPLATSLFALSAFAESAWAAGDPGLADSYAVLRLALYWFWLHAAWRAAPNVGRWIWTPLARIALAAGLVVIILT